ncbi:hypothetical protein A3L11_10595 [Thermococcus siculi]|uniref:PIN domain-containing protein n=1 Tax=Thermococcus siculi TaxID=72803 RepID=A0A2Z2MSK7_9EURY|nr:PIN domain-containing protein [Thermococcus siculi]ASJ09657.1 hypothetical protein A3L11_10595 [Thermococcus siculi]
MIYLDTSVFYHYTTNGEFAEFAEMLLTSEEPKITSDVVVDEFLFIILKKEMGRNFGIKSSPAIREKLSKDPRMAEFAYEIGKKVLAVFEAFNVMVVPDSRDWARTLLFMKHYGLLPHDARIITTALEYGTRKIATFDGDFGRAREIIELVPREYWER